MANWDKSKLLSVSGRESSHPLVGVVGPTATGKSDLGTFLARRVGGEIVNCDSMQVYRRLDAGTAKPAAELRREIPHHLIDVADVSEFFSAGRFQSLARAALAGMRGRGGVPVLVGGTGFYLRALLHGIFEGPGRNDAFRARLEAIRARRGPETLHGILKRVDPLSAERVAPRDHQRVARALEVLKETGAPMSSHFGANEKPLEGYDVRLYYLEVDRAEICRRVDLRVAAMWDAGWVDEVKALLAEGVSPDAKGFEAIGYRDVVRFARGEKTLEEALRQIQADTRRYAKRQATWFRKEAGLIRIPGPGDAAHAREAVCRDLDGWGTLKAHLSEALRWKTESTPAREPGADGPAR